jgi:ring-1,2-phenylacetyl-CoA epoxidase subunit PaaC
VQLCWQIRVAGWSEIRHDGGMTETTSTALCDLTLALADDALVLGHRLSEWSGHAPMLEEDIALSNLALDLIGQAQVLYAYAGTLEDKGRDEDKLAYFRTAGEFRNCLLVEQPNVDFAATMVRHLFFAVLMKGYYEALQASSDQTLADLAGKAVKEMTYHVRHASEWVIRLGDGTGNSHARTAAALDELWSYTGELFEMSAGEKALAAAGVAPDRMSVKAEWDLVVGRVLAEATLTRPGPRGMLTGGRQGRHSEHLGHLLAIMQVLAREQPDAVW